MGQEIERKFLVVGEYKSLAYNKVHICQGYVSLLPKRTVRVRIKDDKGYITVKGEIDETGIRRFEWEKEIPLNEAKDLLKLCGNNLIDKTRYLVKAGTHTVEVDEFYGDNEGLTVAEIELKSVDESFEKPAWLGKEVSGDKRYYNSQLLVNPYKNWKDKQ